MLRRLVHRSSAVPVPFAAALLRRAGLRGPWPSGLGNTTGNTETGKATWGVGGPSEPPKAPARALGGTPPATARRTGLRAAREAR